MRRGPRRVISFLILCVIILTFTGPFLASLARMGMFEHLYLEIFSNVPFGDKIAEITAKVLTDAASLEIDLQDYMTGVAHQRTAIEYILEFCKMCLCGAVFTVLSQAGDKIMEIGEKPKGWTLILKILWYMAATVLCVVVVNSLLSYAFGQIQQISGIFGNVMTVVMTLIAVGGSVGMIGVLAGTSLFVTILYGIVKVLLYNGISLFVTELALSGPLMGLSEGLYRVGHKKYCTMQMLCSIFYVILCLLYGICSQTFKVGS